MEYVVIASIFVVLILIFSIMGWLEKKKQRKYFALLMKERYGQLSDREISLAHQACIRKYYETHKEEDSIDDITWNDLNMDRLFALMNQTYSSAGEEYLYYTLRTLHFNEAGFDTFEEKIEFFINHEKERNSLLFLFADMGKNEKYSIYDYLGFADNLKEEKSLKYQWLASILMIAAIILIFLNTGVGIVATFLVLGLNIAMYFKVKGTILPYITSLRYIMRLVNYGKEILSIDLLVCEEEKEKISAATKQLRSFARNSKYVFSSESSSGNPLEIVRDYFNMIFHLDIILFQKMYRQMQLHEDAIDAINENVGRLEMYIMVGSFRQAVGTYTIPVFDGMEKADNIYHPMIEEPVKNSYDLKRSMLLTGSNASGKSTFLKTVAMNMILSQTIHMACADSFHTAFHRIYSSMALTDNLTAKESYFMVEIKAMNRILKKSRQSGAPIVCFVDEVLRGTNTVERIAASTQILKYMAKHKILCVAATHDIELTTLLEKEYENYHFEEEVKNDEILFNYQLQKGKATSRNAIKLLSVMGYDKQIIEKAEAMAALFMKNNYWEV